MPMTPLVTPRMMVAASFDQLVLLRHPAYAQRLLGTNLAAMSLGTPKQPLGQLMADSRARGREMRAEIGTGKDIIHRDSAARGAASGVGQQTTAPQSPASASSTTSSAQVAAATSGAEASKSTAVTNPRVRPDTVNVRLNVGALSSAVLQSLAPRLQLLPGTAPPVATLNALSAKLVEVASRHGDAPQKPQFMVGEASLRQPLVLPGGQVVFSSEQLATLATPQELRRAVAAALTLLNSSDPAQSMLSSVSRERLQAFAREGDPAVPREMARALATALGLPSEGSPDRPTDRSDRPMARSLDRGADPAGDSAMRAYARPGAADADRLGARATADPADKARPLTAASHSQELARSATPMRPASTQDTAVPSTGQDSRLDNDVRRAGAATMTAVHGDQTALSVDDHQRGKSADVRWASEDWNRITRHLTPAAQSWLEEAGRLEADEEDAAARLAAMQRQLRNWNWDTPVGNGTLWRPSFGLIVLTIAFTLLIGRACSG